MKYLSRNIHIFSVDSPLKKRVLSSIAASHGCGTQVAKKMAADLPEEGRRTLKTGYWTDIYFEESEGCFTSQLQEAILINFDQ